MDWKHVMRVWERERLRRMQSFQSLPCKDEQNDWIRETWVPSWALQKNHHGKKLTTCGYKTRRKTRRQGKSNAVVKAGKAAWPGVGGAVSQGPPPSLSPPRAAPGGQRPGCGGQVAPPRSRRKRAGRGASRSPNHNPPESRRAFRPAAFSKPAEAQSPQTTVPRRRKGYLATQNRVCFRARPGVRGAGCGGETSPPRPSSKPLHFSGLRWVRGEDPWARGRPPRPPPGVHACAQLHFSREAGARQLTPAQESAGHLLSWLVGSFCPPPSPKSLWPPAPWNWRPASPNGSEFVVAVSRT